MQRLLEQISQYEKSMIQTLTEMENIKEKILEVYKVGEESKNEKLVMIPFAAYELQAERHLEEKKDLLDRHSEEKEKMRKHYQKIIIAISSALFALIVGILSIVFYVIANFDIYASYQDITTGDNGTATIEDGIHYNTD